MNDNLKLFSATCRTAVPKDLITIIQAPLKIKEVKKSHISVVSPYKKDSSTCIYRPGVIAALGILAMNTNAGISNHKSTISEAFCIESCFTDDMDTFFLSTEKDNVFNVCKVKKTNEGNVWQPYNVYDDGGVFLIACYIMKMLCKNAGVKGLDSHIDYFLRSVSDILALVKKGTRGGVLNEPLFDATNALALISEVVYREMQKDATLSLLKGGFEVNNLNKGDIKSYIVSPDTMLFGNDLEFFNGYSAFKSSSIKYSLSDYATCELKEDEKKLVPVIPDWYVEPEELESLVRKICVSTKTSKPMRNFMFRGPSSTGKTSLARALASKLNKPYVYLTCSADTESYDFLGQPMYDENGSIKFVESQFIKAIKNGWVVEIQEPYIIAKQGVLTALNGLLDDSNGITLSTGEYVVRHPDTVVLLTTNVDYVGCRQPNQSVLRRMNGIYDIGMPPETEIKKRVVAVTGFKDEKLLDDIIEIFMKVNELLSSEDCTDGVCTVTELIDWVSTIMIEGSIATSAESTIISKATYDADIQLSIANLISAKFANEEYEIE